MNWPTLAKQDWAFGLLGLLMASHLAFLGFAARHCSQMARTGELTEQCSNAPEIFQEAAETYVAILLALMAPSPGSTKPPTTRR